MRRVLWMAVKILAMMLGIYVMQLAVETLMDSAPGARMRELVEHKTRI